MKTLVLLHSIGTDGGLWDPQLAAFGERFHILNHEVRHPPASIAAIGHEVVARLDSLGVERAHVLGLSMGGQVAQWLALEAGARVDRLVLSCTGARIGTATYWDERIAAVRAHGLAAMADAVVERWFTPGFRAHAPVDVARARALLLSTPVEVYAACCAAVRDFDARARLGAVRAPTLVIVGRADPATPPADGRFLADHIPGARLVELDAAHLANIEAAGAFTAAVLDFLGEDDG